MDEGIPYVCPDCLAEVAGPAPSQVEACSACGFVRPPGGWLVDPLTGLILGGRYRLEGRLGAGGMASVFRASRVGALGGKVAVKVLAPRLSRTVVARRFEREAQVVSHLSNPHIVRIYDFDTFTFPGSAQPLYYIAMELVDGSSLSQVLRQQGPVNFMWAIDVLRQAARGLDEAHAAGIVHRDLKPSNIMLLQQREATHVKLVDFGIAALAEIEGEPVEKLTQTGFVSGTPDYMAPEQCIGSHPVGPPADIYALGIVAFEMFTGGRPFSGDSVIDVLMQRVTRPAPSLRDACRGRELPPDIYRVVDRMLAREPKDRYAHAGALLEDLARFPAMLTRPDLPATELDAASAGHELVTLRGRPAVVAGPDAAQIAPTAADTAAAHLGPQVAPTAVATPAMARGPVAPADVTQSVVNRPLARPQPRRWPWWLLGATLIGGGAAAAVLIATQSPPSSPAGPAVGAVVPTLPSRSDATPDANPDRTSADRVEVQDDAHAPPAAAADTRDAPAGTDAHATPPTGPLPDASSPGAALADDATPTDTAQAAPANALGGPRPPLEPGFGTTPLVFGRALLSVGLPTALPPLYRGTPLRLALDEAGAPLRLAGAQLTVTLDPDGQRLGEVTGEARPEDGRVTLELPPLPLAAVYRLTLHATLPDGAVRDFVVMFDATTGRVTATP